jgi:hypothetical protein
MGAHLVDPSSSSRSSPGWYRRNCVSHLPCGFCDGPGDNACLLRLAQVPLLWRSRRSARSLLLAEIVSGIARRSALVRSDHVSRGLDLSLDTAAYVPVHNLIVSARAPASQLMNTYVTVRNLFVLMPKLELRVLELALLDLALLDRALRDLALFKFHPAMSSYVQ